MKRQILITMFMMATVVLWAQVIHVPGDQPTIQEGINAANKGDTVLVAQGTYYENVFFRGKAITLTSNYIFSNDSIDIYNTIIDGSQAINPDSASCVMFMDDEDTTSVLCGFTITGGSGVMYGSLQAQHGGGISAFNAGGKIIHNIIIGNTASGDENAIGGGVSFITASGEKWVVVKNNTISNNSAEAVNQVALGGGVYTSINAIIHNNRITNNFSNSILSEGDGGGVGCHSLFTQEGLLSFENNVVSDNSADGSYCYGVGVFVRYYIVTFSKNLIANNYCDNDKYWGIGALILNPTGKVYVLNNEFRQNIGLTNASPGAGGGLSIRDPNDELVVVDGNLFIENVARHGAGFYCRRPYNTRLTNNVFIGDSAILGGGIGLYMPTNDNPSQFENMLPQVINNSFIGNKALETGGAIRITGDEGDGLLTFNNVFYENEAMNGADIYNNSSFFDIMVYYSNVEENNIAGLWIGESNFYGNPDFNDDSCHISETSICVDMGTTELAIGSDSYYCPDHDIDGQWRPMNATADIGADEYAFTGIPEKPGYNSPFDLLVNPNPCSGALTIQYSVFNIQNTKLEMYAVDGVKVKTLMQGHQQPGEHEQSFDISDLPNGMYLVRLQVGEIVETTKLILLK